MEFIDFRIKLFHNLDHLEKQIDEENLHESDTKAALRMLKTQFERFLEPQSLDCSTYDRREAKQKFKKTIGMEVTTFRKHFIGNLGLVLNERSLYERDADKRT